ncbi:MAG: hypothetical protein HN350_21680, partial [Phycisphaerales bacterium]|nr:hypothetical protein [Phycisphaerales bacterium]
MKKIPFRSLIGRFQIKRPLLVVICCLSYLATFMGEARSVGMKWRDVGSRSGDYCAYTSFIEIQPTGFVRVTFVLRNIDYYPSCHPFVVRNVVTSPKNGLRGSGGFVKGTNNVNKGTSFWLDVVPETKSIQILAPGNEGALTKNTFTIHAAIRGLTEAAVNTNWQQSFQRSETK